MNKTAIQRVDIQGVSVSAINYPMALLEVERWITKKEKHYICVAAAHLIVECQKDKTLLEGVNRAGLVTPDGMPLVWLLKLYGHKKAERVYGPTLMLKTCRLVEEKGYSVFLLGGCSGQSRQLRQELKKRFSMLRIVGCLDTPIRPISENDNQTTIKKINQSGAKMVFVGMGCPYQEKWMINNRRKLDAPVLIGVGAAFDFFSGRVRQAPRWAQQAGLEWLYRLIREPKRLWYRYTVINTAFLFLVVWELFRKRFLFRHE